MNISYDHHPLELFYQNQQDLSSPAVSLQVIVNGRYRQYKPQLSSGRLFNFRLFRYQKLDLMREICYNNRTVLISGTAGAWDQIK